MKKSFDVKSVARLLEVAGDLMKSVGEILTEFAAHEKDSSEEDAGEQD